MEADCRMDVINLYACEPGFQTGKRVFPYHYLLYVHSGKGEYRIGPHTYQAAAGDLFYCPPHTANIIRADETDPFLLSGIEFTAHSGEKPIEGLPAAVNILPDPLLLPLIREMIREYRYGMTGSTEVCRHLLTALVVRTCRLAPEGAPDRRQTVAAMLEYIQDNLGRTLTHKELSSRFAYHKNSINRLLIEATGLPLRPYQISLRIKRASALLTCSHKTVAEIAELCGYQSEVFFSRQFKQKIGLTPSAFRRKGRPEITEND